MRAIRPPRALFGPPAQGEPNPTLRLFVGLLGLLAAAAVAHLGGALSAPAAGAVIAVALYGLYTVSHESAHRLAHANPRANEWLGRVAAALEGMTLPGYRLGHLQHHAHTNDPERDPDWIVGRRPRWMLAWWLVLRGAHTFTWPGRRARFRHARERAEHAATLALQGLIVVGAVLGGYGPELLALWIAPAAAAAAAVFFSVAWLVHRPHESQHPLEASRNLRSRPLRMLTLEQSLHLTHHLWMSIPWFHYGAALPYADAAVSEHRLADRRSDERRPECRI